MTNEACCAHCRVEYRTEDYRLTEADVARMGVRYDPDSPHVPPHAGQLATRGWWECASGCGTRFSPVRPDSPSLSETAAGAPEPWVVWSFEHDAWWRANCRGYSSHLLAAGLYTEEEAKEIERNANPRANSRRGLTKYEEAMPLAEALRREPERLGGCPGSTLVTEVARSSLSGSSPEPQGTTKAHCGDVFTACRDGWMDAARCQPDRNHSHETLSRAAERDARNYCRAKGLDVATTVQPAPAPAKAQLENAELQAELERVRGTAREMLQTFESAPRSSVGSIDNVYTPQVYVTFVERWREALRASGPSLTEASDSVSETTAPSETPEDCRSVDGETVGLIDAAIVSLRLASRRDLSSESVRRALSDLRGDREVASLLANHPLSQETK